VTDPKWLGAYSGQSTDELLALAAEYRVDSIVLAFEQALGQKAARAGHASLTEEERIVLAIEALEREVNNGGYGQFLENDSEQYATIVIDSLKRIGCPAVAEITKRALEIPGEVDERQDELSRCDDLYYQAGEDIEGRLLAFIASSRHAMGPLAPPLPFRNCYRVLQPEVDQRLGWQHCWLGSSGRSDSSSRGGPGAGTDSRTFAASRNRSNDGADHGSCHNLFGRFAIPCLPVAGIGIGFDRNALTVGGSELR